MQTQALSTFYLVLFVSPIINFCEGKKEKYAEAFQSDYLTHPLWCFVSVHCTPNRQYFDTSKGMGMGPITESAWTAKSYYLTHHINFQCFLLLKYHLVPLTFQVCGQQRSLWKISRAMVETVWNLLLRCDLTEDEMDRRTDLLHSFSNVYFQRRRRVDTSMIIFLSEIVLHCCVEMKLIMVPYPPSETLHSS